MTKEPVCGEQEPMGQQEGNDAARMRTDERLASFVGLALSELKASARSAIASDIKRQDAEIQALKERLDKSHYAGAYGKLEGQEADRRLRLMDERFDSLLMGLGARWPVTCELEKDAAGDLRLKAWPPSPVHWGVDAGIKRETPEPTAEEALEKCVAAMEGTGVEDAMRKRFAAMTNPGIEPPGPHAALWNKVREVATTLEKYLADCERRRHDPKESVLGFDQMAGQEAGMRRALNLLNRAMGIESPDGM